MHALPPLMDDLFAPSMVSLVEDAEGGIRYWPHFLQAHVAHVWFECLHAKADWSH